jgi:hypothetical protein
MWQIMHCDDGIARVNACLSGCPDSVFGIVGSAVCDRPVLPNGAYGPECFGSRSLAYTAWQPVQPDER